MKFNWKANWEILLVLVIIVIGIVITTIAAIRNKDKHLPYPTAETEEADFGQLFSPSTGNSLDGGQPPANDQPATSGGTQDGPDYRKQQLAGSGAATRKAAPLPAVAATRLAKAAASSRSQLPTPTNDKHDGGDIVSGPPSLGALDQAYQSAPATSTGRDELYEPTTELPASGGSGGPKHLTASNKRHVSAPSQSTSNFHPHSHHHHQQQHHTRQQQQADMLSEPQDDIHTTRSSLSGSQKGSEQPPAALNNSAGQYQQPQQDDRTPLLAFHGPYGGSFQADSAPLVDGQLAATDGGVEPQTRPTSGAAGYPTRIATANETTYNSTRLHPSDQMMMLMNQQQLANLLMQQQQQQQQQQDQNSGMMAANQQQQRGGYTGSLPISLLLGDLLKLTQPNFGLSSSTGADESAAGARGSYNRGILQQIRSLPGPLMSLLAGGQAGSGAVGQPTSTNHEASESHQNIDYRISMSPADIHSIFARSLGRSADMLPAFPPPKGVLQPWVGPTSGGNPNHTEAQSSNSAEFVAGNTAGFVRAYQQQPTNGDPGPQQYPSDEMDSTFAGSGQQQQHQQQQQQQEGDTISISTLQQQQHQHQMQQENYAHPSANNNYQQQFGPGQAQERPGNQMTPQSHLYANQAGQQQQQFIQQQPAAAFNQAPVYGNTKMNPHRSSEVAVPLGYSPPAQLQLQASLQQQPRMLPGDFGGLAGLESAPKASVVANSITEQQQSGSAAFNRQPIVLGAIANQQRQAGGTQSGGGSKPGRKRRRKRSPSSQSSREQQREREFEAYASKYRDDDWDDSYPLSVVSPDGRPMSNERFRGLSAAASNPPAANRRHHPHRFNQIRDPGDGDDDGGGQMAAHPSQRAASHVDHHHVGSSSSSSSSGGNSEKRGSRDEATNSKRGSNKVVGKKSFQPNHEHRLTDHNEPSQQRRKNRAKKRQRQQSHLETAGSDLMSKLLGTASTNDESEMDVDLDGDDDDANERRKEELEDAEFGILNDSRSRGDSAGGNDISQIDDDGGRSLANQPGAGDDVSRTGSASAGETTYSQRRNQQQQQQQQQPVRSDIEFYGHPGEETRQLKYGILGSGNYEVVNGGIYPEAEESSAAAVNSVANYVRKPGGLLASLPKMLQGGESMGQQHQAAFMPGGRIGGFLRGSASSSQANSPNAPTEQELAELEAALMGGSQQPDDKGAGAELTMPLLDLIDAGHRAAGYQVDGQQHHLISQLGSSARSTHTSKDSDDSTNGDADDDGRRMNAKKQRARQKSSNRPNDNRDPAEDPNRAEQQQRQQSSISGSRRVISGAIGSGSGANQFNRYQILPSKKVTIFSDQDLDSAPSDMSVRSSLASLS